MPFFYFKFSSWAWTSELEIHEVTNMLLGLQSKNFEDFLSNGDF